MATTAAEVIVPSQVASTQLSPAVASSTVWLCATKELQRVFIGPSGVTPAGGMPLPPGQLVGPFNGANALHGVVGEGTGSVAVRVLQIA